VFLAQVLLEYVNGSISTLSGHNKINIGRGLTRTFLRPKPFMRPIHGEVATLLLGKLGVQLDRAAQERI
jgi:hypothetical protein